MSTSPTKRWSFPRAELLPTYAFVASDAVKAEVAKAKADQPLLLLLRRADGNTGFVALAAK